MGESEDWAVCSLASASAREVECPDAVCSQARNEVKCRDASFASLSASGGSLGSLRASNEPNPLNAPNAPNPLNQPHPAPRALIVDDEPDPREVLSRALMAEGYSCATAETAAEALAEIGKAAFDAIVIDYRLPGMNGLELLERVRALRPETATVVITGFGSEETTRKAFLLGADDYLAKPIKLPEFIECVRRAIEKRKAATSRDQVTGVRCQEGDAGQGNRSAIPTPNSAFANLPPPLRAAIQFVQENYAKQTLSLADVAKAAHASESHLSHLFSQHVGVCVSDYLARLRIERVVSALRADSYKTAKEFLTLAGYADESSFYRAFERVTGMAFGEFKKRCRP